MGRKTNNDPARLRKAGPTRGVTRWNLALGLIIVGLLSGCGDADAPVTVVTVTASPESPPAPVAPALDATTIAAARIAATACDGIPDSPEMVAVLVEPAGGWGDDEFGQEVIRVPLEEYKALQAAPARASGAVALDNRWKTLYRSLEDARQSVDDYLDMLREFRTGSMEGGDANDVTDEGRQALDIARSQCSAAAEVLISANGG